MTPAFARHLLNDLKADKVEFVHNIEEGLIAEMRASGFKLKANGAWHFYQRITDSLGGIYESQMDNGMQTGLYRFIKFNGNVTIGQNKNDNRIGEWVTYDKNGEVIERKNLSDRYTDSALTAWNLTPEPPE